MSATTPLSLVLNQFDEIIDASLASVERQEIVLVSGVPIEIDVTVAQMKKMFRFYTDADMSLNDVSNNLMFFVDSADAASIIKNPCSEGIVLISANAAPYTTDASASLYVTNSLNVPYATLGTNHTENDYLRYLSHTLFGTQFGVDLFINETALLTDLTAKGAVVLASIVASIVDVDMSGAVGSRSAAYDFSGNHYCPESDANADWNLSERLMGQMLDSADGRLRFVDLSTNCPLDTATGQRPLPFIAGDSISYNLTINAADNQGAVVGNAGLVIAPRQYRVVFFIKA